jgi:hypothetical protein
MRTLLVVLSILSLVSAGCALRRSPAAAAPAAVSATPPAAYDPCVHEVYQTLKPKYLERPVGARDRDRRYFFELDRACRTYHASLDAPAADSSVRACEHDVYLALRRINAVTADILHDGDHRYLQELDRECRQAREKAASARVTEAESAAARREAARSTVSRTALGAALLALMANLVASVP